MALKAINKRHAKQITAGTEGRLKGHEFENAVAHEINRLHDITVTSFSKTDNPHIFCGNPATILINYIGNHRNATILQCKAHWLGGLATAHQGENIINSRGDIITGSKSDILLELTFSNEKIEMVGVSIKSCKNNAQLALMTATSFCNMLRSYGISVSGDAEIGLKMFCGDEGYSPQSGYMPNDMSNIPINRTARPERWFWEELPTSAQKEWENILNTHQIQITKLLLQKAITYKTDDYPPMFVLHECNKHSSINNCTVAVFSIHELAMYSQKYDRFGIKEQSIKKGKYKDIDLAVHKYPHFGFIQFQPIGNKQNFSELQFNLKSKYYKKITMQI